MRIVKMGKPPNDRKYKCKCPGCGTLVEFLQSEAKYVNDPRDGDFHEVQCPVCPRRITRACDPAYM